MTPTFETEMLGITPPRVLPHALPVAHVTTSKNFQAIAKSASLTPITCTHFKRDLLYLFYGGPYYRLQNLSTHDASWLPVAFVFSPSLLTKIAKFVPFDSGLVLSGRAGEPWITSISPVDPIFMLNGGDPKTPSRIVHCLFESNDGYLGGRIHTSAGTLPTPFPSLVNFLSADLTPAVDHRQSIIECHMAEPLQLGESLLWAGFPEAMTDTFAELCTSLSPHVPQSFRYPVSARAFNPYALGEILQERARKEVIDRYALGPGVAT